MFLNIGQTALNLDYSMQLLTQKNRTIVSFSLHLLKLSRTSWIQRNSQLFRDSASTQPKVFLKNPMPISKVLRAPCICLKFESFDLLGMVLYHHFHFENGY